MATTTAAKEAAKKAARRRRKEDDDDDEDDGIEVPLITAYAPTEDEMHPRVVRVTTRHILYIGFGVMVVLCGSGWFILNVKNKLERQRLTDAIKAAPDTLYAVGYVIDTMAKNDVIGRGSRGPNVPTPPAVPSHQMNSNI